MMPKCPFEIFIGAWQKMHFEVFLLFLLELGLLCGAQFVAVEAILSPLLL